MLAGAITRLSSVCTPVTVRMGRACTAMGRSLVPMRGRSRKDVNYICVMCSVSMRRGYASQQMRGDERSKEGSRLGEP